MIYLQYSILAILVVTISIYLSKYVDALDKKTSMSGAFIGGVLLAAVTSLPELFTSITSILILDEHTLVQGNVLGSNNFNLVIFGICILFAAKKYAHSTISKSHLTVVICSLAMFVVCLFAMFTPKTLNISFLNIHFSSLLIIILYLINVTTMKNEAVIEDNNDCDMDLSVTQIIIRFVILAVILVAVSIMLTKVTDKVTEQLNLGSTIGGALFLGIATSLPELTSSINLVIMGNFNASIGNIVGSNLFNFTILSLSDFLYNKGSIYVNDNQSLNLIYFGIVLCLLTIISLKLKESPVLSIICGFLMISAYVFSIVISI